jgi:very-short-patch-repair endonuclease
LRDRKLIERAKAMRRELAAPELKLWLELRAKRFEGAEFRRQVVVGRYIADFACRTPKMLIIEVDGDTHAERRSYDERRSEFLEQRGYRVIRFTNSDVMTNLDGVLFAIADALATPPLPNPLP